MGIEDVDNLTEQVEDQIQAAVDSAQVVLFVVDCRDGPMPLDQEVAKRLRYLTVPVLLRGQQGRPACAGGPGRRVLPVRAEDDAGQRQGEPRQGGIAGAIRQRLPRGDVGRRLARSSR